MHPDHKLSDDVTGEVAKLVDLINHHIANGRATNEDKRLLDHLVTFQDEEEWAGTLERGHDHRD